MQTYISTGLLDIFHSNDSKVLYISNMAKTEIIINFPLPPQTWCYPAVNGTLHFL